MSYSRTDGRGGWITPLPASMGWRFYFDSGCARGGVAFLAERSCQPNRSPEGAPSTAKWRVTDGKRGIGHFADLMVFDAGEVGTASDYDDPAVPPTGISHVFVNGRPAVEDGLVTRELAGRIQ